MDAKNRLVETAHRDLDAVSINLSCLDATLSQTFGVGPDSESGNCMSCSSSESCDDLHDESSQVVESLAMKLGEINAEVLSDSETTKASTSTDGFLMEECCGDQTPKESIFNSFLPGPMASAPKKKVIKGTGVSTRRQLNFYSCNGSLEDIQSSEDINDAQMVELIAKSIFDLSYEYQWQEINAHLCSVKCGSEEPHKTPAPLRCLNGIAETCPPAPLKQTFKMKRSLSPSICRQLHFED